MDKVKKKEKLHIVPKPNNGNLPVAQNEKKKKFIRKGIAEAKVQKARRREAQVNYQPRFNGIEGSSASGEWGVGRFWGDFQN